tara:strand:- start:815 stop:1303 length:489 start_codon:yes stop_codon:yes gene_type:complete
MTKEFLGDGPIPGASFTEPVGSAPWQKPPKYVDPVKAFMEIVNKLGEESVYERIIFCMEEGLPIEGISRTILNNMVAGGKISFDLSLLMLPEVARVLVALAQRADVDYVLEIPKEVDNTLTEAQLERIKKVKLVEVEEVEDTQEEEVEVKDKSKSRSGLMGK